MEIVELLIITRTWVTVFLAALGIGVFSFVAYQLGRIDQEVNRRPITWTKTLDEARKKRDDRDARAAKASRKALRKARKGVA